MHWLTDYIGQPDHMLPAEQFLRLTGLIQKASHAGFHVVVVSLPMPSWHLAESPFHSQYQKRLRDALGIFSDAEGVRFVDLSASIPDDKFRDSVHPKPEDVRLWVEVLIETLRRQ
jgi:hypothetical protein